MAANKTQINPFDVEVIRKDFPILAEQAHGHPLVYLDNGATTQKPNCVIEAVRSYYQHDNSNVHRGVHLLSERATQAYEGAREKIKTFINANSSKEIIFVRGATEGINLVAQCYGQMNIGQGDEIIVSEMEHHSNIVPWQMLCERTGASIKVLPINNAGEVTVEDFTALLNEHTKLVAITHLSNALGTIPPLEKIIALAHDQGAVVLVDGAQACAHMNVDLQALDADFYVMSAHKMFGPTGVGILYGKEKLLAAMPPYQGGGDMITRVTFDKTTYNELPYKFEAGTPNIAGVIGLGAAIDYIQSIGIESIMAHEQTLLDYATQRAEACEGLRIIGTAKNKASILSFTLGSIHPHDLGTIVDSQGVAIRAGHHCAMPVMQHFKVPATTRASFALYNSTGEIDRLFDALAEAKRVFA